MSSPLHSQQTITDGIHIPYAFQYADTNSRLNATGLLATDIGKLARQLNDDSLWLLSNNNPVIWTPVSGANALTASSHGALRQLIHFIDNGPAEGFASGAYRVMTGSVFPTAITWYDSSGINKNKIVEKLITWTGANPTTITWKMYDATGNLLTTLTDTITYSGPFETSRIRTLS